MGIDFPLKPKREETRKDEERQKERERCLLTPAQPQFEMTFIYLLNFINQVLNYPPSAELQFTSL